MMICHHVEQGAGLPFIFQHGMGGNVTQPQALLGGLSGFRLISMDCRGHGQTPLDDVGQLSFDQSADDVAALADSLGLTTFICGGISMGAGVALNLALRYSGRVLALILIRPAWLDRPQDLPIFKLLAALIREGRGATIVETEAYRQLQHLEPHTVTAIVGQLRREQPQHTSSILERMPADQPIECLDELRQVRVPVLILSSRSDFLHPYEFGTTLQQHLPDAQFEEVPCRYLDPERHRAAVFQSVTRFLRRRGHFT